MGWSLRERDQAWLSLPDRMADCLVLGGGVVGASVAAHAAKAGLDVLLVEKEDFACGASGHSTALAHAGLRYLAQGRVAYVFKESRERRRLQALAPHWVSPFAFVYPVYEGDPFSLPIVRLGTWIYDQLAAVDALLGGIRRPPPHGVLSPDDVARRIPGLTPQRLTGATEYFVDAQVADHRLTVSLAQAAAQAGAGILTHVEPVAIQSVGEDRWSVRLRDRLTAREQTVTARVVINATGCWIDQVRHLAGFGGYQVRKSRGTHLILDRVAEVPLIFSSPDKGRVFFVLPAGRDASVVGTTEVEEPDAWTGEENPSAGEVQSLLALLHRFFPRSPGRVRSLYWASRPLLRIAGASKDVSREFSVVQDSQSFWSVPGVKLTAGRLAGEAVTQQVLRRLNERVPAQIDLGVLPGADRTARLAAWHERHPDDHHPVVPDEPWRAGEAGFSASEEMALTLNDFLWRRSKWPLFRDIPAESLRRLAACMGNQLGWSAPRQEQEIADFQIMQARHRLGS